MSTTNCGSKKKIKWVVMEYYTVGVTNLIEISSYKGRTIQVKPLPLLIPSLFFLEVETVLSNRSYVNYCTKKRV